MEYQNDLFQKLERDIYEFVKVLCRKQWSLFFCTWCTSYYIDVIIKLHFCLSNAMHMHWTEYKIT